MAGPLATYATISAAGTYGPYNLDSSICPMNATLGVFLTGGTATYGVQYTLDDLPNVLPANVRWFDDANLPAGQTASGVTNYMFPVTGVRLVVTALAGGTLELKILQGFSTN
jgi:hypothetical protein